MTVQSTHMLFIIAMGKKKLIDVVTVSVEDRLDSNGALRNVAVKDAWRRLRQNIDVVTVCSVNYESSQILVL